MEIIAWAHGQNNSPFKKRFTIELVLQRLHTIYAYNVDGYTKIILTELYLDVHDESPIFNTLIYTSLGQKLRKDLFMPFNGGERKGIHYLWR